MTKADSRWVCSYAGDGTHTYIVETSYINNDSLYAEVHWKASSITVYCKGIRSSL